jgi:hypothetical protein
MNIASTRTNKWREAAYLNRTGRQTVPVRLLSDGLHFNVAVQNVTEVC